MFATGTLSWPQAEVAVALIGTQYYRPNFPTDLFLSHIPPQAIIAAGTLSGKTAALGVLDANDVTITSVPAMSCDALVIYRNTGTAASSELIAFMDTAVGLPVNPLGGDVHIQWSNDPQVRIMVL